MVKWIIFDVFSTLVEKDKGYTTSEFQRLIGVKVTKEQFLRGFEEAACTRNFKNNKEAARAICDYFHLSCNEQKLKEMSAFRDQGVLKTKLYSGYSKLLPLLKKKGFKLGVLSNTTHSEIKPVEKLYSKYFDNFFYSSDIGLLKPFIEIYEYVLEKLNVKPEEILFIDDKEANLVIPRQLGWKTFYFKGKVTELNAFLKKEKLI
ncbi:Glyceraldehyde 3-phosphate phosphatase [uncultured archaeon]|nr:Glyceraldehyde 3-phosphate phosphatase [uncultured archaeon]